VGRQGRGLGRRRSARAAAVRGPAAAIVAAAALLATAGAVRAQQGGSADAADEAAPTVHLGGLLRTGLLVGPAAYGQNDGFRIHDARLRATGKIGIVFDYRLQASFDRESDRVRLLDAELTLPIRPELAVSIGQFKAPFGGEELKGKGDITFLERAQIDQLLAPGRQVGVQASGSFLEDRLTYRAGMFNGNGTSLQNDDGRFLYAGRVQFNNVGPVEFYEDLMVQVGASVAYAQDSAVDLTHGGSFMGGPLALQGFRGDRTLLGVDLESSYRGFFFRGEYMHGSLDPVGEVVCAGGDPACEAQAAALAPHGVDGGYAEGGYSYLGAIEGVVRLDAMQKNFLFVPAPGPSGTGTRAVGGNFVVVGLNLFPGYHTKLGLQYALGLGDTHLGPSAGGPPLADGQFALTAQVDF